MVRRRGRKMSLVWHATGGRMQNTGLAEDAYARLAASSWPAIRGTAVPIGSRMTAVAATS